MSTAKTDRVWRRGPPPHVGWWNASVMRDRTMWRWWDGKNWSRAECETKSAASAKKPAGLHSEIWLNSEIEWSDFYPANARVPRLDPTDGDWTFNVDGKPPAGLNSGDAIERVYRDGVKGSYKSGSTDPLIWRVDGDRFDIVAWRKRPDHRRPISARKLFGRSVPQ